MSFRIYMVAGCWKGVSGKDLKGIESINYGFNGKLEMRSLSNCKEQCDFDPFCKSFHFHPWQNKHFENCILKKQEITSQTEITNDQGGWTLYWYKKNCTAGNSINGLEI